MYLVMAAIQGGTICYGYELRVQNVVTASRDAICFGFRIGLVYVVTANRGYDLLRIQTWCLL